MKFQSDIKSKENKELKKLIDESKKRPLTREEVTLFVEAEFKECISPMLELDEKFQNFKKKWLE